ncbi:TetR/AcrR family transcriptional regulator [Sporichthya sp.]|uniref:TetR/AcrR family transcriptional regulator n=1 Tax=Sporichthya sp. TaxID=65475 RepID=UPI001814DE13|nr:TetR/AcrR family transcriptional regulator [Sporichthya sp.]MBA3742924.1 TetR/AcrR family transcriptional regulator [Sporichthya sp.]
MPPATARATERLTLEAIVDAAEELVAAEGFEGLSMRKLARHCGVGAMTLYGYVPTKDDLLGALADRLLADLDLPGPADGDWAYRVAAVFHSVRRAFLAHPELVPIVAAHRVDGLSAYRGAEIIFGALREIGLDDGQIISAFSTLTSYTVGAAQREIGLSGRAATGRATLPGISALPGEKFSHVIGLAGRLATRDFDAEFSSGLDLLITGLRGWVENT